MPYKCACRYKHLQDCIVNILKKRLVLENSNRAMTVSKAFGTLKSTWKSQSAIGVRWNCGISVETPHLWKNPIEVSSAVCEHMRKSVPQAVFKLYQNLQLEVGLLTSISEDCDCIISWPMLNSGQVYFSLSWTKP